MGASRRLRGFSFSWVRRRELAAVRLSVLGVGLSVRAGTVGDALAYPWPSGVGRGVGRSPKGAIHIIALRVSPVMAIHVLQ